MAKFDVGLNCETLQSHTTVDSPVPLGYVSATHNPLHSPNLSKCRDYFGVTVTHTPNANGEHPITAYCAVCGYQLKGWRLIVTRKQPLLKYSVFS